MKEIRTRTKIKWNIEIKKLNVHYLSLLRLSLAIGSPSSSSSSFANSSSSYPKRSIACYHFAGIHVVIHIMTSFIRLLPAFAALVDYLNLLFVGTSTTP